VVADIAKLSVGREEYYTRELATDHEQYLSGHGESPGRWYGAGATSLGLQGEASPAGFQQIFEGRHPDTGELLGRPHGRNAVPAFDVVLRPTKSVSILYGLGDPATGRAVLAAHHAGLAEAVGYPDEHLGGRRGHGGHEHVSGQGLLAVGFDHRTSREGGPLVNTHLVIANRIQGPDGRWTALDGRDLYRHRLAADAIYRATYQRELVRTLGVEWTAADGHGNRELAGMPKALVRSFSKRTDQIDAELDRLTEDGRERTPRLVKWTVQATRKPKEHEAPDTLYDRWRQEAADRGVDADTLVRQVTGRTANRDQDQTVSEAATGQLYDPSGRLRHGRYPLAPSLQAVSFEADQAAQVLPDPDVVVVPIVAVHGAQIPWGKVVTNGVPIVSARRLPTMLRALPPCSGPSGSLTWPSGPGPASGPPPDEHA
jgi:conjugative relaxase-like TrwC/TraI family protein